MRKFVHFAAAAAVVVTSVGLSAVPAEARQRHGGWGYRDRDHISTGEVLGGLFILGTIAAIASSASNDRSDRRDRDDRYEPPYRGDDYREVPRYQPESRNDESGTYGNREAAYGNGGAETRAADACSWAVEAEMGDDARVDRIDDTQPNNGGWYVTGIASQSDGAARSFGCSYSNGRVIDVNFGG